MPATIVFDPATMSTGVPSIDAQHKQLIAMINTLVAAMESRAGAAVVGRSIDDMAAYTRSHFAHEEKCMVAAACPVAKVNIMQHAQFMTTVADLAAKY